MQRADEAAESPDEQENIGAAAAEQSEETVKPGSETEQTVSGETEAELSADESAEKTDLVPAVVGSSDQEEKIRKRRKRRRIILRSLATLLLFLALFVTYELLISRYGLKATYYTIETDRIAEDIRVVHLTDLHDAVFGENNSRLIDKVRKQEPDVIFITGDLFNYKHEVKLDKATSLLTALKEIAPVYVSFGNHEMPLIQDDGVDLRTLFEEAGAVVCDWNYVDTEIKGQAVRIGGIYGYCLPFPYAIETGRQQESVFLREFQDTDRFTCLLCHMPVAWIRQHSLYDYDIDCVFSGHVHGGQIILPFAGGVYGPDMGWFPGKMAGIFETDESTYQAYRKYMNRWAIMHHYDATDYSEEGSYKPSYLILSTGLGNTDKVPRFNNIPEVLVLDIKAKGN